MEASECEESQRIVLVGNVFRSALEQVIESASEELSIPFDPDNTQACLCQTTQGREKEQEKRQRLAGVYQPLVAHFFFLVFICFSFICSFCFTASSLSTS